MTLPKGFGSGGGGGGSTSSDISKMIGKRIEDYIPVITGVFVGCWLGTWGGVAVAVTYYPWAFPPPSAHLALTVLTFIESIGYMMCVKVATEGTAKARKYDALIAGVIAAIAVGTVLTDSFYFGG